MIFTLRLLHIFTVNKHLGPKIVIVNKMVRGGVGLVWAGPEEERGGAREGVVESGTQCQGRRRGFGCRGGARVGKGRAQTGLIFLFCR